MCRYLGLLALVFVLPSVESAPAPPPQRYPEVYALMYEGRARDSADNAVRLPETLKAIYSSLQEFRPWEHPEIQKFPVAKSKNEDQLHAWFKDNIRIRIVENTPIFRVWFLAGTPQEQAVIINAFLRDRWPDVTWEQFEEERFRREPRTKRGVQRAKEQYESRLRVLEFATVPRRRR